MRPVLVTRPSPDGEETVKQLKNLHLPAYHLPVMRISLLAPAMPPLSDQDGLLFTSANGVRAWHEAAGLPAQRCFYIGPVTARVAETLGFSITAIADGNVESLGAMALTYTDIPQFWHIRGKHVAGDVVAALQRAGHRAKALKLYEAQSIKTLPPQSIHLITSGPYDITFFSARTVKLFQQLMEGAGLSPYFKMAHAFCLSEEVGKAAQQLGAEKISVSTAPNSEALVDMIKNGRT